MRLAVLVALASLLAAACAAPGTANAPGSSPDRKPYRVDALAFEAPSGFTTESVPFVDSMLWPRSDAKHGGTVGLTLSFCTDRTPGSCGALGVRTSTELGAKRCADREQVRRWLRLLDGHDLFAARHAERDGWLVGGTSGEGYQRVLVLCDGEKVYHVKAIATGAGGVSPAKLAFELFLKTVRIDTPARDFTVVPASGSGSGAAPTPSSR